MAASVVTVPVDDLLRSLSKGGSITTLGPQWGVEAQLQEIHDLLSSVQGVLPEAERKFPYSFELQDRIRELKDAVYDAEDLLEDLSMEEPLRLRDGKLRRLFRHVESCWFGWRIRRELGAITRRLRGLTDPLIGIIHSIPAEVQEVLEAREIPFVEIESEKRRLIKLLLHGDSEVNSVLEVCVNWGCGKAAVVEEVMKDLRVSGYFDVKIWVNASPPFNMNRVVKEIIAGLRDEEEEEEEEGEEFGWEQSIHLIARLLDDTKRYLFVLDNISDRDWWNSEGWWLRFRSLLEGGVASGSKILVRISSDIPGVNIGWTDREDVVVLLRETASQGRDGYHNLFNNPQFLDIAGDISEECSWNPRRIKAVGGYLSLQPPAVEVWTRLLKMLRDSPNHAFSYLLCGGYPYGDLTSPGVKKRYDNLPPRIKQCFALCSLFPRGHHINTHTLAELWISLGFIHNNHDEDDHRRPLEDIAYRYFDVLLREEMFQVKKSDIFGKVKSVTLHPNAQELAPSIAGWECKAYRDDLPGDFYARQYARHQSILMDYEKYIWPLDHKLRTFLHFTEDRTKLKDTYCRLIPKLNPKRNSMRVLDLHDVKADVLPECVWKLKHLRYLDLSGNSMLKMLPPAIIGLLNLQTLKLSGCSSLTELPRDMNNLSALKHLYIDGCWKLSVIPRGLCDLKCLNILTDFILPPDDSSEKADSAGLIDLCKLNDLRGSLKIRILGCYDEELMDEGSEGLLDNKSYLEFVELRFMNLPTDTSLLKKLQPHPNLKGLRIYGYGGSQFPEWMVRLSTHLPNLVEIALIGCENCMYLPLISHLPRLKKLTIQGLPDLEHLESGSGRSLPRDDDDAQPFGNLSALCIKDCPKLNFLPIIPLLMKLTLVNVSEAIFRHPCQLPNLKTLRLENIEFLDHLPEEWLGVLTNIKELHIGSCPSLGSLSWGIDHLEKLETLSIWNCKALDLSKDEQGNVVTELQGLKSLRCLLIYRALKMEHLPEWLSHVATLRFLSIRSCPSLVVLPEWIGSLRSLQLLELIHCPGVASLPEGVHDFTSSYLKKLTVVGCPVLESQLRGNEAEEDGHVAGERRHDSFQSEEEEEQVEQVRKKRGRASHML